jgi:hypothetical protein
VTTLNEFILETLTHHHIARLNFRYGAMLVYPDGYRRDIAHCVRDGLIRPTIDPAVAGITSDPPAGAFRMETAPGSTHWFFVNPRYFDLIGGVPHLKTTMSSNELADLRGTIVHESTHALQDYQRLGRMDPRTAEGAAYVAGAIFRRLCGYRTLGEIVNPTASGISYSLWLADRWLAETDSAHRYLIADRDVDQLGRLVTMAHPDRYMANGI